MLENTQQSDPRGRAFNVAFDPKRHTIKVQGGREYLPVSARLVWFRQEHPDWGIVTQSVEINLEKQYAIFACTIFNEEGRVMATATKMENVKGFGDYIEKAETGAVGRALALCGYGTAFAPELEDGSRYSGNSPAASRYPARQNIPAAPPPRSLPPEPSYSGGNNRPASVERPVPSERPPAPRPAPESFEEATPVAAPPVARVPERPAATPAITRVKEPEKDLSDPGGEFEDEEDPFLNEEPVPRPAARPNGAEPPARRPLAPETTATAVNRPEPREEPVEKEKNSLPRCTVDGCANVLTPSQSGMSQQKFGRAICLMHQRDPAITGAANGSRRNPL